MGRRTYAEERRIQETIVKIVAEDEHGIRWTDLKNKASKQIKGLSPSTLSTYLNRVVDEDGYVERKVDGSIHPPITTYRATPHGRTWLALDPALRKLRTGLAVPTVEEFVVNDIRETGGTVLLKLRLGQTKAEDRKTKAVEATLFVDKKHAGLGEQILPSLDIRNLMSQFASRVTQSLIAVHKGNRKLSTWREKLECERDAYGAELSILLRFDTNKFRSQVDWEQEISEAEKADLNEPWRQTFADLRKIAREKRQQILESFITNWIAFYEGASGGGPDALANDVIRVWEFGELPNPPTKGEIEAIVKEWEQDGLLVRDSDVSVWFRSVHAHDKDDPMEAKREVDSRFDLRRMALAFLSADTETRFPIR